MRHYILYLFLLFSLLSHATNRLDSLLHVLDHTIESKSEYTNQIEQQIKTLKQELSFATVDEQRFHLVGRLFRIYSKYQTDSAFYLAKERVELADKIGEKRMIAEANMNMAQVLRTNGMYKETIELLHDIESNGLQAFDKGYYLHLYHSLYLLTSEYAISPDDKKRYRALVFNYKDSILQITDPSNIDYYLVSSTKNILLGEYDRALSIINEAYEKEPQNAMVTFTASEIYRHLGKVDEEKTYLAESAISDLRAGVKEYISLQNLAAILSEEGDIDRAYTYLKTSMADAIFSNARPRTLEMSRMLPVINETYDIKMTRERTRLFWISIVTIALTLILLAAFLYIYRQVKTLSSIRKYQKKMNTELKKVNEELNLTNSELRDSNLIKEEYIGYVFNICSSYIDKLENFRVTVNRKIKTGQISDLEKMTSTSSLVADELKEFYKNFDTIFLNIYPSFVEDFNALLAEDGKSIPKDGDLLTPELRIFALVRLGITDSVKIADFLHYSPQTIYNYRMRIRNKITIPKEDFSVVFAKIGQDRNLDTLL